MSELETREQLLAAVRHQRHETERLIAEAGDRIDQPGTAGHWSLKELLVHLTGWQRLTAARLEAPLRGDDDPSNPWPASTGTEEENVDAINAWFEDQGRNRSSAEIVAESRETLERIERAIEQLPADDLLEMSRFPWMEGYRLGPGVIGGMIEHFQEHQDEIAASDR